MRRKSERSKEKEKTSPEKKSEKTPRRSRRHSRKTKSTVSASSDKDESGTEENETAMRSSQEDTEEEQAVSLEETSSQVGAIITVDVANTSEIEEDNVTVSTRSRRSMKKHGTEQLPINEDISQTGASKAETSHENEWKEDKQFWEETDSKAESPDSKHKEGRSSVWKVKSSDGKGGEIQKLKLCIVRPQETVEPMGRKKKRLSRSKEKSDVDEYDSSKGSQGEDEKLSSDEKSTMKLEPYTQDVQISNAEKQLSNSSREEEIVQINTSRMNSITQEGEADTPEIEDTTTVASEVGKEGHVAEDTECRKEFSKDDGNESKEELNKKEVKEKLMRHGSPELESVHESTEHLPPRKISPTNEDICITKGNNNNVKSDMVGKNYPFEFSGKSLDEIQICAQVVPEIEASPHKDSTSEDKDSSVNAIDVPMEQSTMSLRESDEILKEGETIGKSIDPTPNSPKETFKIESMKHSSADSVVKATEYGSSDDEKEPQRNDDCKYSSPRFREKCLDKQRKKEPEINIDESEQSIQENLNVNKNKLPNEFKSHSPHRKEKISLRRSFSGKSCELEQRKDDSFILNNSEKIVINDTIHQDNKENDSEKIESDSISGMLHNIPRKRRWGQSNSWRPSKKPVLSISTDSLKTLIPGAKPVTIAEVQLVQDEDTRREGELWGNEKHVDQERLKSDVKDNILEKAPLLLPEASRISVAVTDDHHNKVVTRKISIVSDDARTLQRSPSPPRHKATNVLFITNLVRPFTVNQLKELLARTGKIIEGGFWIDKIKSKCYVEYEKDSEAKETRHALHGVRWPVSNPKTLCVDFGKKEDMEMAQAVAESDEIPRKTEPLKVERSVDWVMEQVREKEREREVREREKEKERERERERARGKERPHHAPSGAMEHDKKIVVREWDLGKVGQTSPPERDTRYDEKNREKERKRREKTHRSRSVSPRDASGRKVKKKEEDAPAKLLDDLFRKTKTTPCIYWLPLTAEQIVVKEEMRRKHMAEHERRMAEMRKAERERERVRAQQRLQRRANEREKRRRHSGSGSPKK